MKVTGAGYESRAVCPPRETSAEGEEESPGKSSGQLTIRDELLNRLYKYLGMIKKTIQHLQIQGLIYLIDQWFLFRNLLLFDIEKTSKDLIEQL